VRAPEDSNDARSSRQEGLSRAAAVWKEERGYVVWQVRQ
jgi:hypothetical protein